MIVVGCAFLIAALDGLSSEVYPIAPLTQLPAASPDVSTQARVGGANAAVGGAVGADPPPPHRCQIRARSAFNTQ